MSTRRRSRRNPAHPARPAVQTSARDSRPPPRNPARPRIAAQSRWRTYELLAGHLGVVPQTIRQWDRQGMPWGDGGESHADQVRGWKLAQGRKARGVIAPPSPPQPNPARQQLEHWTAKWKEAKARRAMFDMRKIEGEVIDLSEARRLFTERALEFRTGLLNLRRRLAGRLVGMEAREIEAELDQEFRGLLESYSRPAGILEGASVGPERSRPKKKARAVEG